MRICIVLDEELIQRAMQLTGIETKRGVIEAALRLLIRLHERPEVRALRGKLHWEGDLDELRKTRGDD